MSLLTVRIFPNLIEANLFKLRLESEGVDCYLFDENIAGMDITYDVAIGGIKAKVNSSDTERVKEILKVLEAEQRAKNMFIKCPVCESTEHYENFVSVKGWWASFLAFLGSAYYTQKYKCKECGNEFV
jgi:hypothetical protein